MKISFKELFCAISEALDEVESLFGSTKNHAKRVAYIAAEMGKKAGLTDSDLADLSACALLHDNALTEYIHTELQAGINLLLKPQLSQLAGHCISGERNIEAMPFYSRVKNVILYHHERADEKGPFGKKIEDVPLYSRFIHLADLVDLGYASQKHAPNRKAEIRHFINSNEGIQFDADTVKLCNECIDEGIVERIENNDIVSLLKTTFPEKYCTYGAEQIISIATIFAKIIDYKSTFTCNHSLGIAQKALKMAHYYKWDKETCAEYYLAGALHDIGKLTVRSDILEKTGKLTPEEYTLIKSHAAATWELLSKVQGFEKIAQWAAFHHEKLDGSGYPFGKKADELSKPARLMACLDIYQALRESRPYKPSKTHEIAMHYLCELADNGKIDKDCVHDIDICFNDTQKSA